jgi:hypothetical protein
MSTKSKLPTIKDLTELFGSLKPHIHDDYRAEGCEDADTPSMDVTVGWTPETSAWSYQTGDNSYTGGAYGHPHWAVVTLTRRSNSRDLAHEVREQLGWLSICYEDAD